MRTIAERDNGPICCDEKTAKVFEAPMVNANFLGGTKNPGYMSPLSDKFISSKKQRNNEMQEFNVVAKV